MYLWAVVAAHDLGLITTECADQLAGSTLHEAATLKRFEGFLYQWYDAANGKVDWGPRTSASMISGGPRSRSSTPPRYSTIRVGALAFEHRG